ncbi:MAG: hypothetical protein ABW019_09515 [Chitinophagaceae bacterium]
MKSFYLYALLACFCFSCHSQPGSGPQLLPAYNDTFYSTVLDAATGVGKPFLLQQGYLQMDGVTVSDTTLIYNGQSYNVYERYENPGPGYYITSDQYPEFSIGQFASVWPTRMPYALYDAASRTFNSTVDCVGYGTRLLSATGSAAAGSNAYLLLGDVIRTKNVTPFAAPGWVASAYEIAAAFPTLTGNEKGWQYVAGNVNARVIDSVNHTMRAGIGTYTGASKGGVANALPGDILSFGYKPGGESNGHFMVVQQQPYLLNADSLSRYFPFQTTANINSLLGRYRVYAVPLFDCSGENIHFFDSRKQMSGIGHGTLLLLADPVSDIPQGFIFSPSGSPAEPPRPLVGELMGGHVVAITIGRYKAV